jgi:hypothetical protein
MLREGRSLGAKAALLLLLFLPRSHDFRRGLWRHGIFPGSTPNFSGMCEVIKTKMTGRPALVDTEQKRSQKKF